MMRTMWVSLGCFSIAVLLALLAPQPATADDDGTAAAGQLLVYVGTYTRGGKSKGIYVGRLDLARGALSQIGVAAESENPSFLALHPSGKFLYAVNEVASFGDEKNGAVSAFAVDPADGRLTLLNQQASGGGGPCHLVVDRDGRHALVANYGGGSVACLPIGDDGRLAPRSSFIQHRGSSVNARRQSAPHAHSINLDQENRFAVAADLGLDKLLVYRFDAGRGLLTPHDPPSAAVAPGAGPRHFAFHPSGRYAYVINEMNLTVTAFGYDGQRGVLSPLQTIATVPDDAPRSGLSTAEVRVHPSGKFLYGSNRGHDSIVVFGIDQDTGRLTHVENEPTRGRTPRNFFIEPGGKYLLAENQASDTVVVFRIDAATGALTPTGHVASVPSPVCIRTLAPSP